MSDAHPTETIAPDVVQPRPGVEHEPKTSRASQVPETLRGEYLVVAYVVIAVAVLILLRALIDTELDFLGVGWILVLVALPLIPWLLPRLGEFLKAISPY